MTATSNSFWRDPRWRELIVATAAGVVWAILGAALFAHDATPTPNSPAPSPSRRGEVAGTRVATSVLSNSSCRIHNSLPDGTTNVGSGTLVDVTADGRHGLVLSCAHLFTEGQGRIIVEFPGGRRHAANLIAIDREADLSALEIATPPSVATPIALAFDRTATLTACGFGPTGEYRCLAGRIVGMSDSSGQENVQIAGAVRSGDSGGGVFDPNGRLVAVVWGESGGVTYATTGGPLRRFAERVLGRGRSATALASTPVCPDGRCPLVRPMGPALPVMPGSLGGPPAGRGPAAGGGVIVGGGAAAGGTAIGACPCNCGGACGTQLALITAQLESLAAGKQDRGEYLTPDALGPLAHRDELAAADSASRERHQTILERLEAIAVVAAAAGSKAAPLALPALGVTGPAGLAAVIALSVGGTLLARRLRRRGKVRGSRSEKAAAAVPLAPHSSPLAPLPESPPRDATFRSAVRIETHAPIERDDREARELLRLSQLEGRDPLQDALAGRLALDRLDAVADSDADPDRAALADELRRELRERFNEIAPTKFEVRSDK
jgi:S1-C subfamily serine protease